jgi:peptidoglycan/xylan/chitin deacetylase (PgdA/CDA1 family)
MSSGPAIPILLYHSLTVDATDVYRRFAMPPQVFAQQMDRIADRGHTVMSVGELVAALGDPAARMPSRPLVMTFDDGFVDTLEVGAPILAQHGFHATLYVVTRRHGRTRSPLAGEGERARPILTPAQVRELEAAGIEVGPHSHRHVPLDTLPFDLAAEQIDTSKAVLEDVLGHAVSTFAYPYGYHTRRIKAHLRASGFTSACGVKQALSHGADDTFALGRIIVGSDTAPETFESWLDGEGLPRSWRRERLRTIVWRVARRARGDGRGVERALDSVDG